MKVDMKGYFVESNVLREYDGNEYRELELAKEIDEKGNQNKVRVSGAPKDLVRAKTHTRVDISADVNCYVKDWGNRIRLVGNVKIAPSKEASE